jgi:NADPH:quinone reductase
VFDIWNHIPQKCNTSVTPAGSTLAYHHRRQGEHMRAVELTQHGGPEVLRLVEVAPPAATGAVLVRVAYAGVNFVDSYQRQGSYPDVQLPFRPGIEGAGVVSEAPAESGFSVGQRVAFACLATGSYAEVIRVEPGALAEVPSDISLKDAASILEHGLTAFSLIDEVARVSQKSTVVIHAAAGGVGAWLTQLCLHRGARVFGTASTAEKRLRLREWGAVALSYGEKADWVAQVLEATQSKGAEVVFDSVGADTFTHSLQATSFCGHVVLCGAASGNVPSVPIASLAAKSLTVSRPRLHHYLKAGQDFRQKARRVFDVFAGGQIRIEPVEVFGLEAVQRAHERLASRDRRGKVLLHVSPIEA